MKLLLQLFIALLITVFSDSSKAVLSQITQKQIVQEHNLPIKSISIVEELPWSTPGIEDPIAWVGLSVITEFELPVRKAPYLANTAKGKLWLLRGDTLLKKESNSWQIVKIDAAKIDRLISIALLDDLIIMLGRNGDENVLAALDTEGKLLWRRSGAYDDKQVNLTNLRGDLRYLLVDIDGQVYLPGTEIYGTVARINPVTSVTPEVLDFGEYNGGEVYIRNGELFYILATDNVRYWIRRKIGSNQETRVRGSETMQDTFASIKGILPDGGALLLQRDNKGSSLIWMSPQGETIKKITLSGVARYDQDIYAAFPVNEKMAVAHFSPKNNIQTEALDPLPDNATLVDVDPNKYTFMLPTDTFGLMRVINIDRQTKQRTETTLSGESILDIDTKLDLGNIIIIDQNTLILTCVDAQGAFFIRVENA
ncbi:MAG TPA: hypothetical protein VK184_10360 [Nostocaceae cyanobacterium]|nr:hypothetical protein [Nostocaceae cyanobacterium]